MGQHPGSRQAPLPQTGPDSGVLTFYPAKSHMCLCNLNTCRDYRKTKPSHTQEGYVSALSASIRKGESLKSLTSDLTFKQTEKDQLKTNVSRTEEKKKKQKKSSVKQDKKQQRKPLKPESGSVRSIKLTNLRLRKERRLKLTTCR